MAKDVPGIDVNSEMLLTIAEAAAHPALRRSGEKACHRAKLYRLFNTGIRGVKLEFVRTPSGLRTSADAIQRFISRLTYGQSVPVTTVAEKRRRARVDRELELAGI